MFPPVLNHELSFLWGPVKARRCLYTLILILDSRGHVMLLWRVGLRLETVLKRSMTRKIFSCLKRKPNIFFQDEIWLSWLMHDVTHSPVLLRPKMADNEVLTVKKIIIKISDHCKDSSIQTGWNCSPRIQNWRLNNVQFTELK